MAKYIRPASTTMMIMARGIVLLGSFVSSAIVVMESKPRNEKQTSEAPARMEEKDTPFPAAKGLKPAVIPPWRPL
ncbi:hypothetical protein D3C73_1346650 [compost metagenome]